MGFIFGGNTGETADSLARKRMLAEAMMGRVAHPARNLGEGLAVLGNALGGRMLANRVAKREGEERGKATAAFNDIFSHSRNSDPIMPGSFMAEPEMSGGSSPAPASYVNDRVSSAHSGVPQELLDALIQQESAGNPNAVSPKGAMGLAQAMPDTARDPGFGVAPLKDPFNPEESRRFAKDYLGAMLDRYKGDQTKALVAYNWGPGNADKWSGQAADLPQETQNYVSTIMSALGKNAAPAPVSAPANTPFSGIDPRMLQLAGNEFLSDGQKTILNAMIQSQLAANKPLDPLKQLQMRKLQHELDTGGRPWWAREDGTVDPAKLAATKAGVPDNFGTIPSGFMLQKGPDGVSMVPVPGSPADKEAKDAALQDEQRKNSKSTSASIVLDEIDIAKHLIQNSDMPTTGLPGGILASIDETDAGRLKNRLETIKANIGFDKLQAMRDASPTGGALGQVSEFENRLLQAVFGSLQQSQKAEDLMYNLERLKGLYDRVVNQGIPDDEARQMYRDMVLGKQPADDGDLSKLSDDELLQMLSR